MVAVVVPLIVAERGRSCQVCGKLQKICLLTGGGSMDRKGVVYVLVNESMKIRRGGSCARPYNLPCR